MKKLTTSGSFPQAPQKAKVNLQEHRSINCKILSKTLNLTTSVSQPGRTYKYFILGTYNWAPLYMMTF